MRFIYRVLSSVLLFLFLSGVLAASTWQVYDTSSGLPGNKVTSFAVGKKQMAVGTTQGVAVFDGETCQWSPLPLPADIASAEVRDLAYDDNEGLWMATSNGLCFLPAESENTRNASRETRQANVVRYLVEDGLPNIDAGRIQVTGATVMAGFFGGYVARGTVPQGGKCTFQPVNYLPARLDEGALKIRSVGVTGLAMKDSIDGWFSTQGSGLVKVSGLSMRVLDQSAGLGSDWVDSFWIFPGESRSEHLLAATGEGLTMLRDEQVLGKTAFPREGVWLTSLVAYLDTQDTAGRKPDPNDEPLRKFLLGRSLWVGTKSDGL
ncbi:MAG TPA: hypothetical protein PKO06_11990, partial [Candidatus Ozemobacteraceae bacterium]|nr:hypothetical protein [Candidatus Ozemobacteraceae bacterium]